MCVQPAELFIRFSMDLLKFASLITYQSCKTEHKQIFFFHILNLMVILTHELAITVLPEDTYLRCNPVKLVKYKFAYAFMCLNKIVCFLGSFFFASQAVFVPLSLCWFLLLWEHFALK